MHTDAVVRMTHVLQQLHEKKQGKLRARVQHKQRTHQQQAEHESTENRARINSTKCINDTAILTRSFGPIMVCISSKRLHESS